MPFRILLTGFTPFAGLRVNPSEEIVRQISENAHPLPEVSLSVEVLPTEFQAAGDKICGNICRFLPNSVLILGVAPGSDHFRLERLAVNLDDSDMPDESGDAPDGRPIESTGPVAYRATLPTTLLAKTLKRRQIPVRFSNHAGTYVCNHTLYAALHVIETKQLDTQCGLVHLPLMSEQAEETRGVGLPTLPLTAMVEAVHACIETLRDDYLTRRRGRASF